MPPEDHDNHDPKNHALPSKKEKVIRPLHEDTEPALSDESAINLIREKLNTLYDQEPRAQKELSEDKAHHGRRSKHQQFMHDLSVSGKPLAEIQTAWHNYYVNLPDEEKHQVWQEFYANYNQASSAKPTPKVQTAASRPHHTAPETLPAYEPPRRTPAKIKNDIKQKVSARSQRENKATHHKSSLKFGLISGFIAVAIMMFGFFNERVLVPFIKPSHAIGATPLILEEGGEVGPEPKLIIPKINIEVPVVYDQESIAEDAVQESLEDGVLHYATTPEPGERGNSVIFGHSSNNIFNEGDYKYVFVQLKQLESGDTFFVHKDGTRYVYEVYDKKIVKPSEVSVLGNTDREATMTLITCDPPGTAINRLVVIAEQISPDPDENTQSSATTRTTAAEPEVLPSNAPSLWQRFTDWLF
ncbi:MAG: class D sortase [Candidatus Saccharibacteria bacterium]|nr:class D sortase [Candidatus Saccharibacteria bacterium]